MSPGEALPTEGLCQPHGVLGAPGAKKLQRGQGSCTLRAVAYFWGGGFLPPEVSTGERQLPSGTEADVLSRASKLIANPDRLTVVLRHTRAREKCAMNPAFSAPAESSTKRSAR